jgi:hypothetical protein
MEISTRDLIIRLDESRDALQLLVLQKNSESIKLYILDEIFTNQIPDTKNFENYIGESILAFLSANYITKSFNLDKYRQAAKDFNKFISNESTTLLNSENTNDKFEGIILHLSQFNETWSLEDIDKITTLLIQAAENGSEKAFQFLRNEWPALSKIFKKRLNRILGLRSLD